jgi:hypothetical protein
MRMFGIIDPEERSTTILINFEKMKGDHGNILLDQQNESQSYL